MPITAKLFARPVRRVWFCLLVLLAAFPATAQEAINNIQAGESAADQRSALMKSPEQNNYTFKDGDFRLLLEPSMSLEWNDNVNLSKTNTQDDFILKPALGIRASYPFTEKNLLFVDITVGYDRYLKHPGLSSFDLNSASGTGLSFDVGVEDFTFNFHDWISYVQDSAQTPNTANTDNFGTFQNTSGLSATWDMNQATTTLGYDHQIVLATSSDNQINHNSDMLNARFGVRVHPQWTVGTEATATFTTYEQSYLNNNNAYTLGAYAEFSPGQTLKATLRGGFSTYQFQGGSTAIGTNPPVRTSDQNSWYGSINLSHAPRESIAYSLEAGHEVQLGIQSDLVEDWYVRPTVTWKFIRGTSFVTGFFYEHGDQGVGNVSGNLNENFDWYGGQFSVQQTLTSRLTLDLTYRLTVRSSTIPNDEYTQNLVGLQLTYHPK